MSSSTVNATGGGDPSPFRRLLDRRGCGPAAEARELRATIEGG